MSLLHPAQTLRAGNGSRFTATNASAVKPYGSVLLTLAVALFIGLRLWHLTDLPSFDEIFSIHAVRHQWDGLFAFVRRDLVHPPLFYILFKLWSMVGGESLVWLRLFSTLLALISIIPLMRICRELDLDLTEKTSALTLLATNGFLIYYSHLLRMYSLLLFLGLCSLSVFLKIYKAEGMDRIQFWTITIVNLLLVYTHYFGWILIGVELLVLGRRHNQKFRHFLESTALVGMVFGVWVYAIAEIYATRGLSQNLGWINRPRLSTLAAFFTTLNDKPFDFAWSGRLGLLLFGAPIIWTCCTYLLAARKVDHRGDSSFWFLFIFSFFPVLIVFLASSLPVQSIWLPRGLLFAVVPYLILVAVSATRLRPRWISAVTLALLVNWSLLAGFKTMSWGSDTARVNDWVGEMVHLESDGSDKVRIYALDEHTPYFTWFYLSSANDRKFEIVLVRDISSSKSKEAYWLTTEMFPAVTVEELTSLEGEHFWVSFSAEHWHAKDKPQEIFQHAGYRVGEGFQGGPQNKRTYLFPVWRKG
jgi:uncharacterized membrane protein